MTSAYRRAGFTLIAVLQWILVIGVVGATGFALVHQAVRVQTRSGAWALNHVSVEHLLRCLRADVARAADAKTPEAEVPTLVLRTADQTVTYTQEADRVRRVIIPVDGTVQEQHWPVPRSTFAWQIEPAPRTKLLWIRIDEQIPAVEGPFPTPHRFATAYRLGTSTLDRHLTEEP